jgi:UDP-N-acetyl-D-glucosamine dehydrogenase
MINLCVVGLGYVGLPLAVNAAKAGFNVIGFDIDEIKISQLKLGQSNLLDILPKEIIDLQEQGSLSFSRKISRASEISIFVIAVPTPLDSKRKPDVSMLETACDHVANSAIENSLIINESTSYIGTLRNLIKPRIDRVSGLKNLKYAVAPERIDPGNKTWNIKNTPRIIAGINRESLSSAVQFYSTFCGDIVEVSSPEVAEAAKLFENTFRQVNIALVNELSKIADSLSFSAHETISAASTKPFGFMPFFPSIGVGGHCIPIDPSYLAFSAEQVGNDSEFIKLANKTNSLMPRVVAERIKSYLGGNLNSKRIQLAGISYKCETSDLRESPALKLITELKSLGAIVNWHDPLVLTHNGEKSSNLDGGIDLGLIVTPHAQIDFSIWKELQTNVIDLSSNPINYGWPKFF